MTRAAQQRYRLVTPGRPVLRAPKREVVLGVIESLPRDGHAVLASMDQPEVYIQVWLRSDGSYQLELRDGSVHTHKQTRSVSRERVSAAFTSWLQEHSGEADAGWRDTLHWNDISGTLSNGPQV